MNINNLSVFGQIKANNTENAFKTETYDTTGASLKVDGGLFVEKNISTNGIAYIDTISANNKSLLTIESSTLINGSLNIKKGIVGTINNLNVYNTSTEGTYKIPFFTDTTSDPSGSTYSRKFLKNSGLTIDIISGSEPSITADITGHAGEDVLTTTFNSHVATKTSKTTNGHVTVGNNINVSSGIISLPQSLETNTELTVKKINATTSATIKDLIVTNDTSINGDLTVDGDLTLNGKLSIIDTANILTVTNEDVSTKDSVIELYKLNSEGDYPALDTTAKGISFNYSSAENVPLKGFFGIPYRSDQKRMFVAIDDISYNDGENSDDAITEDGHTYLDAKFGTITATNSGSVDGDLIVYGNSTFQAVGDSTAGSIAITGKLISNSLIGLNILSLNDKNLTVASNSTAGSIGVSGKTSVSSLKAGYLNLGSKTLTVSNNSTTGTLTNSGNSTISTLNVGTVDLGTKKLTVATDSTANTIDVSSSLNASNITVGDVELKQLSTYKKLTVLNDSTVKSLNVVDGTSTGTLTVNGNASIGSLTLKNGTLYKPLSITTKASIGSLEMGTHTLTVNGNSTSGAITNTGSSNITSLKAGYLNLGTHTLTGSSNSTISGSITNTGTANVTSLKTGYLNLGVNALTVNSDSTIAGSLTSSGIATISSLEVNKLYMPTKTLTVNSNSTIAGTSTLNNVVVDSLEADHINASGRTVNVTGDFTFDSGNLGTIIAASTTVGTVSNPDFDINLEGDTTITGGNLGNVDIDKTYSKYLKATSNTIISSNDVGITGGNLGLVNITNTTIGKLQSSYKITPSSNITFGSGDLGVVDIASTTVGTLYSTHTITPSGNLTCSTGDLGVVDFNTTRANYFNSNHTITPTGNISFKDGDLGTVDFENVTASDLVADGLILSATGSGTAKFVGSSSLGIASLAETALTVESPKEVTEDGDASAVFKGGVYIEKHLVVNAGNDMADFIECQKDLEVEYGKCYCFDGENYSVSNKRRQKNVIGIASDTYAMKIGSSKGKNNIPIGVAGFVLAYVDKEYPVGTALICTKDGGLTKANLIDRIFFNDRIIATYWKKDKERMWVKIK